MANRRNGRKVQRKSDTQAQLRLRGTNAVWGSEDQFRFTCIRLLITLSFYPHHMPPLYSFYPFLFILSF